MQRPRGRPCDRRGGAIVKSAEPLTVAEQDDLFSRMPEWAEAELGRFSVEFQNVCRMKATILAYRNAGDWRDRLAEVLRRAVTIIGNGHDADEHVDWLEDAARILAAEQSK